MCKLSIIYVWSSERKKYKTIQTLLKSNRKNRWSRGNLYAHLQDCSLSWIGQVASKEIDDVKLVLCSQASPLSAMMRSCKCFLRQYNDTPRIVFDNQYSRLSLSVQS
jgi:hypothetical protein